MTRTMLAGLAAAAVLAVLADAPADAQQFRQPGGAQLSYSGGIDAATGGGSAQPVPQGSQRLRGNQRSVAGPGTHLHGVYAYQVRRKKLDSLLPID